MMSDNCKKYEGLFIFGDEATLQEHVDSCQDCKAEQEKMDKVSALLQEVRPAYKKKKKTYKAFQAACMIFTLFVCGVSVTTLDSKYGILDTVKYGQALTMEDMGFPVDSYGLLMVE